MNRRSFLRLLPIGLSVSPLQQALSQSAFRMTLVRTFEGSVCTTGELFVNGRFLCHTLERPWRDNQEYISSIPAKLYGGTLRYDHIDQWRIELRKEDTLPRTLVQIHIGNFPKQTLGCILPGMQLHNANAEILESGIAYDRLKAAFYGTDDPIASPNKVISLDIRYNTGPTEFVFQYDEPNSEARYKQDGTAWLLYSHSENGRHVWDEVERTGDSIIFKGTGDSGFWKGRQVRLPLHGGGDMQIKESGGGWATFGEGAKITRRDATSKI
jgi:Family of unknown function (DUF5675)